MEKVISFFGLFVLLGLAWLLSNNKKQVDWKLVMTGVLIQILLGILILWTPPGEIFFEGARIFVAKILSFSDQGAEMVFGADFRDHFFAFSVLATIVFFSSLMSVLFYLGVIQKVVGGMAWVMIKIMRVSGAEALAASANVFVGQTEAPLVVKPYITKMTRSELMALMTGGMATVAGGVLAAFVSFGVDAGHLLAASIMSAPASLVIAKIILPELQKPLTMGETKVHLELKDENVLDAACRGATEGLKLAVNVIAMLIAFVALMGLLNYLLTLLPNLNGEPLTFQRLLGWFFAPIAYIIGVDGKDIWLVGGLLGQKMFLNEFVAYLSLKDLKDVLSERSFVIATYALCGFANFSSIAIQIGGIGGLVPSRRKDFAQLGFKAMLGGTLAALMTATIAGTLI